jgi:hypothetical protein
LSGHGFDFLKCFNATGSIDQKSPAAAAGPQLVATSRTHAKRPMMTHNPQSDISLTPDSANARIPSYLHLNAALCFSCLSITSIASMIRICGFALQ